MRLISFALMGAHLHSSTTRPGTAPCECSSGLTFGSMVLISGSSVKFSVPVTGLQSMKWLQHHSLCTQHLENWGVFLPWLTCLYLSLPRYKSDEEEPENKPLICGKLLALCDYMHMRALFTDKAQMDKVLQCY